MNPQPSDVTKKKRIRTKDFLTHNRRGKKQTFARITLPTEVYVYIYICIEEKHARQERIDDQQWGKRGVCDGGTGGTNQVATNKRRAMKNTDRKCVKRKRKRVL